MSGILADWQIRDLGLKGMITPFEGSAISKVDNDKIVSYGVSSYGYDIRVCDQFKGARFLGPHMVYDPKRPDPQFFEDLQTNPYEPFITMPAKSFMLSRTIETFNIPRDIMVVCLGKSTYARCGIKVEITPLEPEWRGQLTLEITNNAPFPCRVYANEGIAQLLFFRGEQICDRSYNDKNDGKAGKYQDQAGIVLARA